MKTIYASLLSVFFIAQTAQAQFTILNDWHGPKDGTSHGLRKYDSTTAVPKAMGANQTWDFSTLSMASASTMISYKTASTVASHTMFPSTATLVADKGGDHYFYNATSASLELVGKVAGTATTSYSNPKMVMRWETNINPTWNDTYAGNALNSTITGTINGNSNNHGTVILPGGKSFTNCVMVHVTDMMMLTDSVAATNSYTQTTHQYIYYYDLQHYPILMVTYMSNTMGTATTNSVMIEVNHLEAVGINDHNFDASYAIYPNPASGAISVKLSNEKALGCTVEFINTTGQLVKKAELGNMSDINAEIGISDIPSGVYFVKTTLGTATSVKKLVKQ